MIRIIDGRGTGKTYKLLEAANDKKAVVVCNNPEGMKVKAEAYGFNDLAFMGYGGYINEAFLQGSHQPVFIDELETFLEYAVSDCIAGYTISVE